MPSSIDPLLSLPGKKGACLVIKDANDLELVQSLDPHWHYSWNVKLPFATALPNAEWVPQVWGGAKSMQLMQEKLDEHIIPRIENGLCHRLLCFNEPDKVHQANMTVEDCLKFWPLFEKLNIPLCSPSCANPLGSSGGKQRSACQGVTGAWMPDFMAEASKRNYRVDYIGVHWYGGANFATFKDTMKEIYETYDRRPLLITEFAVADWDCDCCERNRHSQKRVLEFMKHTLPWLERQEWVIGYAWFSFGVDQHQGTSSALFNKQRKLTALGRFYKSVTAENPNGNQEIDVDKH